MIYRHVAHPAPRYLMRLAVLQEMFPRIKGPLARFLEVGAGSGDVSEYVSCRFPEASGLVLDFAEATVSRLAQRFRGNDRIRIASTDIASLAEHERFDLVMAFEVLEHIEDDGAALRKIGAVTAPGGVLLISVPAFRRKWQAVDRYSGHYRRYEWAELQTRIESAGFEVDSMVCYGFPVTWISYPLRQLHYRRALRESLPDVSLREMTEASGIERPYSRALGKLRLDMLLRPFFGIQRWFYRSELGDGFVVLARRRSGV